MMRCCARMVGIALFVVCMLSFSPVHAEEKAAAGGDAAIGPILDLLKEKKIITGDEAAAFMRQTGNKAMPREDLKALVNLLREKGVVSGEEAAGFIQTIAGTPLPAEEKGSASQAPAGKIEEGDKMILPSDDKQFVGLLKELWVKNGNRGDDFDNLFAESKDVEEIIGRMRVMGVLSSAEADELDKSYREKYLSGAITTVLENKENDYLERIRKNVSWEIDEKLQNKLKKEWWQNVRLGGDFRLRYQGDFFDENNLVQPKPDKPTEPMNTQTDRHRARIRARLGVDAKLTDEVSVGIGLATGTTSDPVSTNVTLGDFFNKKSIQFDKAYLKWSPDPSVAFWGGRFPNPWFCTDLVWDQDVNFDGVAVQYRPQLSPSWSLFFNAGAFPLQEVELSSRDKWLFGGQLGVQYKRWDNLTARLGAAFYDFENTVGIPNSFVGDTTNDYTAPQFQQKGNTLMAISGDAAGFTTKTAYASEFKELNITGSLDIGVWDPVHVVLSADYVNNLGFDQEEVDARAAFPGQHIAKETEGYQLGLTVGYPKVQEFGAWKGFLFYKYLEADAVMDAFTDSDFHLGGTNAKGWIVGGEYGLTKNVWLTTRWLTANEISGFPLAIDVFQFDLNARF